MASTKIRQAIVFYDCRTYNRRMVFEHNDYRKFLRTVLDEKAVQSPGYSLRAFADKLQISNSFLSEVLNAKKSLSLDLAFKIAVKLDLTQAETQYLCLLVQLEQEKDPTFKETLQQRLNSLNPQKPTYDLSVDLFRTMADWYHLAILELTFLTGFSVTAKSVSDKLSISKIDAELAIERLERLELIEKAKVGYKKTKGYMLATSQIPNEAFKQCHKQILEKAALAVQEQTPEQRMSATDVLAIDSKYVKEVDRLSQEFSAAVHALSDKSKVKNSVYALSVHFFKLTKPSEVTK